LTEKGRCAVLWPHGVLFRNEEQEMRSKMIEKDWVEGVIGLGPNLFYNSPMESCIVICNRKKSKARKGKVIFIDALNEVARERAQSFLKIEHQSRILDAFKAFEDVLGFSRIVELSEIRNNNSNLSIPLYVKKASNALREEGPSEVLPLSLAIKDWKIQGQVFWQEIDEVNLMLESLNLDSAK